MAWVLLVLYSIYALWARGTSPVLPPQWRGALAAGAGMPEVFSELCSEVELDQLAGVVLFLR